jgi:hypothetical protein
MEGAKERKQRQILVPSLWKTLQPVTIEKKFLPDNNDNLFYLLYFWRRLDEEGYLQFTLAKFPDGVAADSSTFRVLLQDGWAGKNLKINPPRTKR